MKFLAFKWRGFDSLGWLLDDKETVLLIDRDSRGMPQSVMDVIKRGPYARHQIKQAEKSMERLNINELEILPPIIPWATFCVTTNSSDQAEADKLIEGEHPTISLRTPRNHVAHGEVIDIPLRSKTLECEGKLVVVMGKGGRYITQEHALRHVFGYSIYNDGNVKGYQQHTSQFGVGKMFDMSASFGPIVVTEDEFGDPYQQTIETRIDGELVQSASLAKMRHTIEDIIVYISSCVTMFPGDIICIGMAVDGTAKPERFMQINEKIDISISGISTLSNVIKAEPTVPKTVGCC